MPRNILIQLDTDSQASAFDRIVALDAGAEVVLSYPGVTPEQVCGIVHGAIFTRGPDDLKHTALFIGGADLEAAERLLAEASRHMIPQYGLRVSVLLDASGANTTAAAVLRAASRHLELAGASALVLGGTGSVGRRIVGLLARRGASVAVTSHKLSVAQEVCRNLAEQIPGARLEAADGTTAEGLHAALAGRGLIVSAGPPGVTLLSAELHDRPTSRVVIDLNAVPPAGIEGIGVGDKGALRNGAFTYGAIGVGSIKMKIHKAAMARLFERNDLVLDAEGVDALAESLQ